MIKETIERAHFFFLQSEHLALHSRFMEFHHIDIAIRHIVKTTGIAVTLDERYMAQYIQHQFMSDSNKRENFVKFRVSIPESQ